MEVDALEPLHLPLRVGAEEDVAREPQAHVGAEVLVLQDPGMVHVPPVAELRAPTDQPALGPPLVLDVGVELLHVDAPDEAGIGAEVRVDAVEVEAVAEMAAVAPELRVEHRSAQGVAVEVAVRRGDGQELRPVGLAEPELTVDSRHAAVRVEELAVGHDRADVRLRVDVVAGPPDDEVRRFAEAVRVRVVELAGRLVVGHQNAERRVAGLAGELGADLRVDDGLGVDEVRAARRAEDLLSLEEERPQLGEEERVALVGLYLGAIRLDLREVGIEGEVGGEDST